MSLYFKTQQSQDVLDLTERVLLQLKAVKSEVNLDNFRATITPAVESIVNADYGQFKTFICNLSKKQDTVKFWFEFVFKNSLPYLSLYAGLRYRNWDLRLCALKELAAVYTAFDSYLSRTSTEAPLRPCNLTTTHSNPLQK